MNLPSPSQAEPRDRGAAMVITLMIVALVTVVTTTMLSATVNNLKGSRQSRDAAQALDAADAGLSQAITYLRTFGVAGLDCSPTCATNPYGNSTAPAAFDLPGGQSVEVWIEDFAPLPANNPGIYIVHSTGFADDGIRTIEARLSMGSRPIGLPLGIFARSISGGGAATVTRESVFALGCVFSRSKISMPPRSATNPTQHMDVAYNKPAAVHSASYITDANGNGGDCGPDNKSVHRTNKCNSDYPYDQSVQGGAAPLTGDCADAMNYPSVYAARNLDGITQANFSGSDVSGSFLRDETALRTLFGFPEEPFTAAQLDSLRQVAQSQGHLFTSRAGAAQIKPPTQVPHAVVFFDLDAEPTNQREVDLNDVNGWGRAENPDPSNTTACPKRSLLIVIEGGNVKINSNQRMAANLVLTSPSPLGQVNKANGTASFIGTIYADTVNLVGTMNMSMDACFMANLSPSLLDTTINVVDYRELDRGEVVERD